jgi:hypothetical protein
VLAACALIPALLAAKPVPKQNLKAGDNAAITLSVSDAELTISYRASEALTEHTRVYLAIGSHQQIGAAVLPFQREQAGSTVFLPFKADRFISAPGSPSGAVQEQKWENWKWNPPQETKQIKAAAHEGTITFHIPRSYFAGAKVVDCAIYAKDLSQNDGWGKLFGCSDAAVAAGVGDQYITRYLELNLGATNDQIATSKARLAAREKMRIYQLFVRLFGNTNETRKEDGTLAENGVGKFEDINNAALTSLRQMGFTHLWLTGVLQQATATDYSAIGQPADDPDLLKGLAGSPYAIKDYFDVCPDYAVDPAKRV